MNKSEMLRALARKNGVCGKWYDEWEDNCTEDELVYKFVEGQNFCSRYDYPGIDIIRSFSDNVLLSHNVFCDKQGSLHNPTDELTQKRFIICGDSDLDVMLDGYTIADIFIYHNSKVRIVCKNHAICFVTTIGKPNVSITNESVNKVCVYNHSQDSLISHIGNVKYYDKTEHGKSVSINTIK